MKTFKLISIDLIKTLEKEVRVCAFPILDGLIIDREDEDSQWVLECLLDKKYLTYFTSLKEANNELVLQAKITKETNQPATFLSTLIAINEMDQHINVLFKGKLSDQDLRIGKKKPTVHSIIGGENQLEKD
ncbi:YwpF family protein [Aquibacillus sediminis]|uniref:YwpF family protein n=1 Tax=Aquibacillus sediminis TaxID=2574734 RepID=UPI001108D545|nr:YwpF family protein [Aquibacillus sediminis]